MVRDLVHNLCGSLVENIGGVAGIGKKPQPTPITYLTQWKIVGKSEVHSLPYPDGVILPNGYKRCEYLTFNGSSYINTGIKTANDIGYNFACSTNGNQSKCLIGSRLSKITQGFVLGFEYVAYGGVSSVKGITYNQTKTTVILDSTQCKVGGINYDLSDIRAIADSFFDIYIGSWNNNGSADPRMWTGNIYDTIIYNTQGELWHGIPCLDANDVPCFYDIVSHTAFYNQGSGSFTYKLYPQPTEIWSCGEYNATDGKYHILVQPQGGSIADIVLDEPLRMDDDFADTIEFPSDTEGKALVTRNTRSIDLGTCTYSSVEYGFYSQNIINSALKPVSGRSMDVLCAAYPNAAAPWTDGCMGITAGGAIWIADKSYESTSAIKVALAGVEMIYKLATPTTELVDAPQIEEAESYTCVISQGGKAVSWSSFTWG